MVNNLITLSLDPTDPALRTLLLEAAGQEFENHRLTSHIMLTMGLFYGLFMNFLIFRPLVHTYTEASHRAPGPHLDI